MKKEVSVDINSIRTFVHVASLENFSMAAEEMNYAQSTVTMQIRRLEEELGFPLFERIGRKNYLTSAGQNFLPHALEILHIMQKVSLLGQESDQVSGTLRIGALESLMYSAVLDALPQFRKLYPNVDISIRIGQCTELLTLLKQNQLDFIFISSNIVSDSFSYCCFRQTAEIIFIAGANHPLAGKKKIPVEKVLSYPFIVTEASGCCYSRLHEIASQAGIELRHPVMVDNIGIIMQLLPNEQSITFLPEYSLKEKLQRGDICKLDVDIKPQTYYSQLIYHKNKWLPQYMQVFIQLLKESSAIFLGKENAAQE